MSIEEYYEICKSDAIKFMELFKQLDFNLEVSKVIFFQNLPFRGSINIYKEKDALSDCMGVKIDSYWQLLYFLLRDVYPKNDIMTLSAYISLYNIDFSSFFTEWKLGLNTSKYKDKNQTYCDCINTFDSYDSTFRKTSLGNAGEYIVNDYLASLQSRANIWVSRDVGDGFGYDFVSHDLANNKYDYIEVKAIPDFGDKTIYERILSNNETNVLKRIDFSPTNEQSHVFFVPVHPEGNCLRYELIDLYYDQGILQSYSLTNQEYLTITPLEEDKYSKYSLIKQPKKA